MSRLGQTLPLHIFIRRRQVVHLYRHLLKACKNVDDSSVKSDLIDEIKLEFHTNKELEEKIAIKNAITQGNRSLTQLNDMIGGQNRVYGSNAIAGESSWLDTNDCDDERGRVGTDWPWSR
mmetsp:Transcript_24737/g.41242  ORF Transcript_24737/g.41242 Transcript_24737/m.41242 type:complete len:120 (+) Transcript_24737:16-375(+)